jgi:hypothetical protein
MIEEAERGLWDSRIVQEFFAMPALSQEAA